MTNEDRVLAETARAIASGQPVDWPAATSRADGDRPTVEVLRELQVVQDIEALHRSLSEDGLATPAPALTAQARTGATWGPLRLLERIGQGAFGDVYRAWDPRLDRVVALKLLRRLDAAGGARESMVIEEGRLLARVHHPNVVAVFGADRVDGRVGLWMEFVEGRTLAAMVRDDGPFDAAGAAGIGRDLCRALGAVHRAGMLHLDVKAQNVMRATDGRTVLMDFGAGREDLAGPVPLAGTPLYLAPEVMNRAAATAASDIYSVGVLLFHLVTRSYPVTGRSLEELRAAHRARRAIRLRDIRRSLPKEFCAAVDRALESDPGRRYPGADAMEQALTQVLEPTHPARAARAVARNRSGFGFSLVAFAMAVVLLAVLPLRTSSWSGRPATSLRRAVLSSRVQNPPRHISLPESLTPGQPSPDGRFFSFIDTTGNLAMLELGSGRISAVTGDAVLQGNSSQFALNGAISADNQFLAYTWYALDGRYELRVVPSAGQVAHVLVRGDVFDYVVPLEWSRDGASILTLLYKPDGSIQLALVSSEDGHVAIVKDFGTSQPSHAGLSHDGRFVVFDAPSRASSTARDIFVVGSDGRNEHPLITGPASDNSPAWSPDDRQVVFFSNRSGAPGLWSVEVAEGIASAEPTLVRAGLGRAFFAGLTDSGDYVYHKVVGSVDVYQAAFDGRQVGAPVQFGYDTAGSNISSLWSPDGTSVAYASREATFDAEPRGTVIVIRDLLSGAERRLRPAMTSFLLKSWSPDRERLLVQGADLRGRRGAYAVEAASGRVAPLVTNDVVGRADWLPDGRVLYLSRAQRQLVALSPSSGERHPLFDLRDEPGEIVADVNGRGFRLSPDGRTLALTTRTVENGVQRLSLRVRRDGTSRELASVLGSQLRFQDWTPDSLSLLYTQWTTTTRAPQVSLWRIDAAGGQPQQLGLAALGLRDLSINPSGSSVTFTAGWPATDVFLLHNILNRP